MTVNTTNILNRKEKQDLQFLIEGFLEKKENQIADDLRGHPEQTRDCLDRLDKILFKNTFWMDEVNLDDMAAAEQLCIILQWHQMLRPHWISFRNAIFDFKYHFEPERQTASIISSGESGPDATPYDEYKDLATYDPLNEEKYYNLNLMPSDLKTTVSFEGNRISIHKRSLDIVHNLFDILNNIPVDLFSRCKFCRKSIITTRVGKEYCPGCAAKEKQQERWKEDPEAAREKERRRYEERRKKVSKSS
ncbi:MAG: hypothetical protein WC405_08990 [Syntrophales bacterium]